MVEKLNAEMRFSEVRLIVVDRSGVKLPADIITDYAVVLFLPGTLVIILPST